MRKKQNPTRSITAPFQLVIQSHDYPFVPCDSIKNDWDLIFKKLYTGPAQVHKLDKNGHLIINIPGYKNNKKIAQEVIVYNMDENGLYLDTKDIQRWPKKLYPQLPNLKTDQDVSDFIRKTGFCDFPTSKGSVKEKKFYLSKFVPTETGVRAANWLILWRELSTLSDIIQNVSKNKVTKQDINYLMEQRKQNVLDIVFDKDSFAYRELKDPDIDFKQSDFLNEYQPQEIRKANITTGYRVFGHIALCCLELLLDIQKGTLTRFCENKFCKKPLPLNAHGRQKYCNEKTNPTCYRQWRAAEKRKERTGIKLKKIVKKKPIPKRRLV